ncbi:RNA polymerase subunit sigma-70 [Bacillus toyonensis]|uniref:RNA polymerase sigma factor n=1 Tax=Bacillus cereus group TaxID=86661 RepID=UPI000BEBF0FE|nr:MULTISPECIES: RNA polymerase sigma factor [Bacillus cereus group]MBJ7930828.1 RNA polymerase sigma factor [Bacillus cereus group sp. N31]PEG13730.1 RNA polymerase subunit sigma-70 [Bacillus toyonensis]
MRDDVFQKRLKQYLSFIFNYLLKLGISREDAEDIVQEAALKYIENLEGIPPEKVKSWLFRVAINRSYDILRRKKRKDKFLIELCILENLESDLPEDCLLKEEQSGEIKKTLDLLPKRYREVLILKYVVGLRYDDIALLFEVTTGTVKTTVFRAKEYFINIYRRINNEHKE